MPLPPPPPCAPPTGAVLAVPFWWLTSQPYIERYNLDDNGKPVQAAARTVGPEDVKDQVGARRWACVRVPSGEEGAPARQLLARSHRSDGVSRPPFVRAGGGRRQDCRVSGLHACLRAWPWAPNPARPHTQSQPVNFHNPKLPR